MGAMNLGGRGGAWGENSAGALFADDFKEEGNEGKA